MLTSSSCVQLTSCSRGSSASRSWGCRRVLPLSAPSFNVLSVGGSDTGDWAQNTIHVKAILCHYIHFRLSDSLNFIFYWLFACVCSLVHSWAFAVHAGAHMWWSWDNLLRAGVGLSLSHCFEAGFFTLDCRLAGQGAFGWISCLYVQFPYEGWSSRWMALHLGFYVGLGARTQPLDFHDRFLYPLGFLPAPLFILKQPCVVGVARIFFQCGTWDLKVKPLVTAI